MRRKSWFRPFATLLAVWLPFVIGEPGVLHLCPTHRGVASAPVAATAESGPAAHDHGAPFAQDPALSASQGSTNDESTPGHDHHDCSCISSCVGIFAPLHHRTAARLARRV